MAVPITPGSGATSIAAEGIGANQYQQIKIVGGETGSTSVLGVNPDRSMNVSVFGTANVSGSVAAWLQSTNASIITVGAAAANQSVSGTVGASILGAPPANVFVGGALATAANPLPVTTPTAGFFVVNTSNSSVIATIQGSVATAIISGSIAATFTPPANQSVSGTVGSSVIGWVPAQLSNTSVITVAQANSVAGTYQEDAAHTQSDRGLFVLGVRNDTLASVTSADGDYSAMIQGPVGETIVANAPITKWVQGTADLRGNAGASVAVIAAQGASIFTYITGVQIANMGSASVLVTLSGATSSIIGYSIAPAGGGSNLVYLNALKTNANGAFTASISGVASVLVSAQGFISKT